MTWSEGVDEDTFVTGIPVYIDGKGAARKLANYLAKTEEQEKRLVSVMDMPGMGKTATIKEAAKLMGAVYVPLPLSNSTLPNLVKYAQLAALEYLCERSGALGWQVREHMSDTITFGLAQILQALATDLPDISSGGEEKDKGFGNAGDATNAIMLFDLPGGVRASVDEVDRDGVSGTKLEEAKDAVRNGLKWAGQKVVVHVDEAQILATPKGADLKALQAGVATPTTVETLRFTALVDALFHLHDLMGGAFRVVVSGTLESINASIHIASSHKLYEYPCLAEFDAGMVGKVVKHFCCFPPDSLDHLNAAFVRLAGPARNTQFFLHALAQSDAVVQSDAEDEAVVATRIVDRIDEAVDGACELWTKQVLSRMCVGSFPASLATQLFLAMVAPEGIGAKRIDNRASCHGYVVRFAKDSLKGFDWADHADAGAFRLKGGSHTYDLFPAYPFLADVIAKRCVVVNNDDALFLLNLANTAGKSSDTWRGYLAEVMLALELAIPSSNLYNVLTVTDQHARMEKYRPLKMFNVNNEVRAEDADLWLVDDTTKGRAGKTRMGDVIAVLRHKSESVFAVAEVKAAEYAVGKAKDHVQDHVKQAYSSVGPMSNVPRKSVFAFFSVHSTRALKDTVEKWVCDQAGAHNFECTLLADLSRSSRTPPKGLRLVFALKRKADASVGAASAAAAGAEEDVEDADVYFVFLDSLEAEDTFFDFSRLHEAVASPSVGRYTLATLLGLLAPRLSLASGVWVCGWARGWV